MTNLATALVFVLTQVLPNVDADRLKSVSDDVIFVVDSDLKDGALKSNINRAEAISMVTAAAVHESGLRLEVENCKLQGDGGKSVGLGQVMQGINWEGHSRKEICGNRKLQLRLALHVIDRCWQRTPRPDASFRCYTSGDAAKDSYAAKKEFSIYRKIKPAVDAQISSEIEADRVARETDKSTGAVIAKNP